MSTPMSGRFGHRLATALLLGVSLAALPGCERSASGLTEWTPADHDHQFEPKKRHATATVAPANPHAPPTKKNQVIDVTWQKQCATCHGKRGRGDGPQSPMVKARDLSSPEWQGSVDDAELSRVIKQGKDKMPAFNLPDSVIEGLVAHVRSLARKPKERGPAQPETDDDADEASAGDAPAEPAPPNAPARAASPAPATAPAAKGGKNVPAAAAAPPADGAHGSAGTDTAAQPPTAAPAPKP
jgi:mono/diheme cytochrome c family protein